MCIAPLFAAGKHIMDHGHGVLWIDVSVRAGGGGKRGSRT